MVASWRRTASSLAISTGFSTGGVVCACNDMARRKANRRLVFAADVMASYLVKLVPVTRRYPLEFCHFGRASGLHSNGIVGDFNNFIWLIIQTEFIVDSLLGQRQRRIRI